MKSTFTISSLVFMTSLSLGGLRAQAILPSQAVFANEEADTTKITAILNDVMPADPYAPIEQTLVTIAKGFVGTPYVAGTLEGEEERLRVRTDGMDCTTFVETVIALGITVNERRTSWRDFIYNLERIRYRNGELNGYPSRLHYVSDWIVDNCHRGNTEEVTSKVGRTDYAVKTIDFMSQHRDKYPALKDSANYAGIKNVEIGYRSHRFPYIKSMNVKNASLRDGDIVMITCKAKELDVSHMGIITIADDGKPHLIHASSKAKKVIIDPDPLPEYLRKNYSATGIRVLRIAQ